MANVPILEDNLTPIRSALGVVTPALVIGVGIAIVMRLPELQIARLGGAMFFGGVVLAAWAHQSRDRWTWRGYLWRYAISCAIVVTWGLICGRGPMT